MSNYSAQKLFEDGTFIYVQPQKRFAKPPSTISRVWMRQQENDIYSRRAGQGIISTAGPVSAPLCEEEESWQSPKNNLQQAADVQ